MERGKIPEVISQKNPIFLYSTGDNEAPNNGLPDSKGSKKVQITKGEQRVRMSTFSGNAKAISVKTSKRHTVLGIAWVSAHPASSATRTRPKRPHCPSPPPPFLLLPSPRPRGQLGQEPVCERRNAIATSSCAAHHDDRHQQRHMCNGKPEKFKKYAFERNYSKATSWTPNVETRKTENCCDGCCVAVA